VNALNEQNHVLAVYICQKARICLRLLIENLFCRNCKKNIHKSTVTKKQVEEQMRKWLVGARDRGGRRIIRAEKAEEKRIQDF